MDENDKWLALLYLLNVILGSSSLACMGIVWWYWASSLDHCSEDLRDVHGYVVMSNRDSCGCILYGSSTFSGFVGSDTMICRFVTFAHLPPVLISCAFALYHGYRVCETKKHRDPAGRSVIVIDKDGTRRAEVVYGVTSRSSVFYTAFAVNSGLFSILLFVAAVVFTDGYYHSCNQYKHVVIKTIMATGNLARMMGDRLSCSATFDFLDYIQPDSAASIAPYYNGGTGVINTAALLNVVFVFTWAHFITWLMTGIINIIAAKQFKRNHRAATNLQPLNTDL